MQIGATWAIWFFVQSCGPGFVKWWCFLHLQENCLPVIEHCRTRPRAFHSQEIFQARCIKQCIKGFIREWFQPLLLTSGHEMVASLLLGNVFVIDYRKSGPQAGY